MRNTAGKKKVLYIITKATNGGAQKYVYDLATNMPKEQFEPIVAYGAHGKLAEDLSTVGIQVLRFPSLGRDLAIVGDIKSFFEILKIIRKIKPDVLHLNSSKAGGLGALAGRIAGIRRIVFTSHGLPYDEDRGVIQKLLIYMSTWLTFLLCHVVICISKDTAARAKNMWLMKHRIHLVYNGISTFAMLAQEEARASLRKINPSIPQEAFWIGTISELVRNKGLSYAIDACALLKKSGHKFAFLILGSGDLHDELTAKIQKQNLTDTVFLLGFVSNARKYMRAFDIFTLTSVKEGLPYVLLEAAQAPLTVVGSDIPGIRDIVEDGESDILVPPKDPTALAAALLRLSQDAPLRERMGQKLADKISRDFSLESMLEQTIAMYLSHYTAPTISVSSRA